MHKHRSRTLAAVLVSVCAIFGLVAATARQSAQGAPLVVPSCPLGNGAGQIKHVIYLQFDNTHYRRDNPNVASDLEQMPHLLNFLQSEGTLFTNDHTILISHTAGGILSSLTGLYPDRGGPTVSNSYGFFKPDGTVGFSSVFKYWTDQVDATLDPLPNMITDGQKTTPAPWVPFTRNGCDVGGVGTANIELENTNTGPTGDMTRVFGVNSPEWLEAQNNPQLALTDFVGIAVHCSQSTTSVCNSKGANPKPDPLADEPGGYTGFNALYGAKYVDPAITGGNACVNNTAGLPIQDAKGNCGFPGFDGMLATNTLGYVAQMQENGVPVTYGYISDAHDIHVPSPGSDSFVSTAAGPGQFEYQQQLKAYDDAFAAFFTNLANHGINKSNSLFVITVDEGDHFAGGIGSPDPNHPGSLAYTHANCATNAQGVLACPSNQIGEVQANLQPLTGRSDFAVHSDDAPTFYLNGNPAPGSMTVRSLEHQLAGMKLTDPYVNNGQQLPIAVNFADPVEEATLHMVNNDPNRTPTFTMFGNDDIFFTASSSGPTCGSNPCVSPTFAWNHGDVQQEIGNTWVGMVGPGVGANGINSTTWTDHTNLRPTIMDLTGLKDDYTEDGVVLTQGLTTDAIPPTLDAQKALAQQLGQLYEQLNAPFGKFGSDTLKASTTAIESNVRFDEKYNSIETSIRILTGQRNTLVAKIHDALQGATFGGQPINPGAAAVWQVQGATLLALAGALGSTGL
jgi:hypothetical protein